MEKISYLAHVEVGAGEPEPSAATIECIYPAEKPITSAATIAASLRCSRATGAPDRNGEPIKDALLASHHLRST
jgi:hypothetical protein